MGAVAFVGDRLVATAERFGSVHMFDKTTLEPVRTMRVDKLYGHVLAASPDGTHVAASSWGHDIEVFDVESGAHARKLKGHTFWVRQVVFTPDGKRLLSCAGDRTIRVWDLASGATLHVLDPHRLEVLDLALLPGTTRFVTGGEDGAVILHDWVRGKVLRRVAQFASPVVRIAVSPSGRLLAAGFQDGTVQVLEIESGDMQVALRGHTARVHGLAFASEGRIVTASADATIRSWNAATGAPGSVQIGHAGAVTALSLDPAGRLATSSEDKTVRFWNVDARPAATALFKEHGHLEAVAFNPDGSRVACAGWRCMARILDIESGDVVAVARGHTARVFSAAFSPDGSLLATGSLDKTVRTWDAATGAPRDVWNVGASASFVTWSPDGVVAAGLNDGTVRFLRPERKVPMRTIRVDERNVLAIAFHPSGRTLVTGATDGYVRVWDRATGRPIHAMVHSRSVRAVAFHPGGTLIASSASDGSIRIWDGDKGTHVQSLLGHSTGVVSLSYAPDGARLASASADRTVRLWHVATGATMITFKDAGGRCVRFSADGTRLASTGFDSIVRIWETERPADYYPRAARRKRLAAEMRPLVDGLFAELRYSPFVVERLEATFDLAPDEKDIALRLARNREEDHWDLHAQALAVVRRPAGDHPEARRAAEAALRIHPDQPVMLMLVGAAYLRTGDHARALEMLRRAERQGYATADQLAFTTLALCRAGQIDEARRTLARLEKRLKKSEHRPEVLALAREARTACQN